MFKFFLRLIVVFCFVPAVAFAGELDSSSAPDATESYKLEDIYNRLNDGTGGSKSTFTEPPASPGTAGTGRTLNDIMGKAPEQDDTDGAVKAEVAKDKTFWGLTSGEWGPQTGTYEEPAPTCSGTLSGGGRWCDMGDGTVKDMTTGLYWLKNANCTDTLASIAGGTMKWNKAVIWSSLIKSGDCGLSDSSSNGDWHLPTKSELHRLANGSEAVRSSAMQAFTGVKSDRYWTSTSYSGSTTYAWGVAMSCGSVGYGNKTFVGYYQ